MSDDRFAFDATPDPRAVAFLEGKGVRRSWRWPSMWGNEHAYAFTLAGVYRLDVLAETKRLVTEAIAEGQTLETFQAGFRAKMESLGFAGKQLVEDFEEGPRKVELTAPWRMRVIYDRNVSQAYAASQWQAIEETVGDFPALQYHHTDQLHPRLEHLAFDKIVLPVRHAFWRTHYPQNGWFCKCFTIQISVDELASGAVTLTSDDQLRGAGYVADPRFWREFKHTATGRTDLVPFGVSPGFAHNAGMDRRRNLGELLERRVENLDEDMARAASADLVNLPVFADLVGDAIRIGQARAAARATTAGRLAGGSATRDEISQAVEDAAAAAGAFPADSWPVGVAPAEIRAVAPGAGRLVVANASAIGHSADVHPTSAADWRRVQLLLERGEVWRGERDELVLFGQFAAGGAERTWMMALKPVAGAFRVRTLFESSPRRRARKVRGLRPVRPGAGVIDLIG